MIGMIDQHGIADGEFARIHVRLNIFAGEKDTGIGAGGHLRARAMVRMRTELRAEYGKKHHVRPVRKHPVVFFPSRRKKKTKDIRCELRPEKSKSTFYLRFHGTPRTGPADK